MTIYTFKYIHDIFLIILIPFILLISGAYYLISRCKNNAYTTPIAYGIIYSSTLIFVLSIVVIGSAVYLYSR